MGYCVMRIGNFVIYKEKANVISHEPIWIIFQSFYMYSSPYFIGVWWQMITEWQNERHIVG